MPETADSLIRSCRQRWNEFYDLSSRRRVICLVRYSPELPPRPLPNPERRQERLEWIWQNYETHLRRMQWLEDDTLPCLDMLTGTELFAEAFGCAVHRPADNNPFAMPCVNTAQAADRLKTPGLDAPPLALVFEMADELARRAGAGALFRLPDLQSPLDIAALIWEKTSFYTALIENPASVMDLAEKIKALQFAFLDEWFRRYGREFIAHYPDYYLPQGVTLSVDEIGAVSRGMFATFFLPHLNQFSERYGGLGIHCCAHARHQWEGFKQVSGLRLLNLNTDGAMLRQAYPFFAGCTAQWHNDQSPVPLDMLTWLTLIPENAHVVVELFAASPDEALRLCGEIRRTYG